MNNRDIDKLVASRLMGWTEIRESGFNGFDFVGVDPNRKPTDWYLIPHYSLDFRDTRQIETRIDQTPNLFNEYVSALTDILEIPKTGQGFSKGEVWAFLRATPRQRALAALKCMGVEIQADSEVRP